MGNKFAMGMRLKQGFEITKNEAKAFEILNEALREDPKYKNEDTPYILNLIAVFYKYGSGNVKVDIRKSIEMLEKACKLDHPTSFYNLAEIYESGREGIILIFF